MTLPLTRPGIPNSCHVDDDLDGSIYPQTFSFKGVNVPSVNSKRKVSEKGIDLRMDATTSSSVTEAVDANTIAPLVDPGLAGPAATARTSTQNFVLHSLLLPFILRWKICSTFDEYRINPAHVPHKFPYYRHATLHEYLDCFSSDSQVRLCRC
jgi:hypothetical protein